MSFAVGGIPGKGDASDEDDDNEFFDAMEDPAEFITVPADPKYHRLATSIFQGFLLFNLLRPVSNGELLACPPGGLAATSVGSAVRLEQTISQSMCVNFVFLAKFFICIDLSSIQLPDPFFSLPVR